MTKYNLAPAMYIHIPFCIKKCDYCDFYSVSRFDTYLLDSYTQSVIEEIKERSENFTGGKLETIFFGGGTPSLLSGLQLTNIMDTIARYYPLDKNIEVSLEANPATLDEKKLASLKEAGINRLSLGVQSFSDPELKQLGRIHGKREIMDTIDLIIKKGIDNYNIDLIYGIPGQTQQSWMRNLELASESNPSHISIYLLQLEPETVMARRIIKGEIEKLDEEIECEMYYTAIEFLQEQGYEHYEISNFASYGYQCRHNAIYWQAREYIGIGSGAVSFIDDSRFINEASISNYIQGPRIVQVLEKMTFQEKVVDSIILQLRLSKGINRQVFKNRYGIDIFEKYNDVLKLCVDRGLLNIEKDQISLSKKGYFLSNQVFCQFIS